MQRAAPADAACCASTCSALRFPNQNETFPKSPRSFSPANPLLHLPKSASRAFGGIFFSPGNTLRSPWKSSSHAFGVFFFPKDNPLLHPPKSASHAIGGFPFSPDNTLRSPWNSASHAFRGFFFSPSNPFRSFQRSPPQPSAIAFQKQGFAFMTEAKPDF